MTTFAINFFLAFLNFACAAVFWNVNPELLLLFNLAVGAFCFTMAIVALVQELR